MMSSLQRGKSKMSERFEPFAKAREITKPVLPKRFYDKVTVEHGANGYEVRLDGRAIKTPGGKIVAVPTKALAELLANEWSGQGEHIDAATMPLTKLCNSAIEMVTANPEAIISELAGFASHDLVCYRADHPEALSAQQAKAWDEVVDLMQAKLGPRFSVTCGVLSVDQPQALVPALEARLSRLDAFKLTALHAMATLVTSVSLALLVLEGDLAPEDAWKRGHVDEDWNIAQWGEDHEAAMRRQSRWREFEACAKLIKAVDNSA